MPYKSSIEKKVQLRHAIHRRKIPGVAFVVRFLFSWRFLIVSSFLVYFLGLTLKPGGGDDEYVPTSAIIDSIRSLSPVFYFYGLLAMAFFSFRTRHVQRPVLSPSLISFMLFFLYYIMRLLFDALPLDKLVAAFFGQIVLTLLVAFYFSPGKHLVKKVDDFLLALRGWAVIYTMLTFVNLLAGYGYALGVPRYYGVTSHPNFAGVALAISSIVLFDLFVRNKLEKLYLVISFSLFALSSYLCFLTASRTAFMMYAVFLGIYVYLRFGRSVSSRFLLLMLSGLVAVVFVFLWNSHVFVGNDVISRVSHAGNDRSEVWSTMTDIMIKNFVFGAGYDIGASESSYLKALGSTGGIFGSLYMVSILSTLFFSLKVMFAPRRLSTAFSFSPLFVALSIGLILGAVFEGYLVELAGPWVFLFIAGGQIVFSVYKAGRISKQSRAVIYATGARNII